MSTDSSDLEPPVETIEQPPGESIEQPPGQEAGESVAQKKKPSFLKELPVLILIAFGLALLIKTFLIQAFYIPSESMVPTLNIGDRVLVNKVVYKIRDPRRGEVIVFVGQQGPKPKRSFLTRFREALTSGLGGAQPAELDYIKRIVALPGETVEVRPEGVTITPKSGSPFTLAEPYRAHGSMG
ncbi:MAG: signal peptidase I, partial [Actinomycetota bacterium]